MKSLRLLFIVVGLILSVSLSMTGQSCDPQLTSVNVINRDSFCLTNNSTDFVELEIQWALSGSNPLCSAPMGSWRIQISMPSNYVYKVDNAGDVVTPGPFNWTYDMANNTLRGINNAPLDIGSNGVVTVNISGDGPNLTSCGEISTVVNIEIVSLGQGGSPGNFDNIIGNDSGEFDLEVRAPMNVSAGTILSCYPDLASAEAAAIAATAVVNTGGCFYPDIVKLASTTGNCDKVITVTVANECGDEQTVVYYTSVDVTNPPLATPPPARTLEGCSLSDIPEAKVITLSPTQSANTYYTDRYAPAGFVVENYMSGDRLKHTISNSDCESCRPGGFNTAFYNTQGRKFDTPNALSLAIDLYIPNDWAATGRRMAGLWGTGLNNVNATSSFPIIEFTSDGGVPRFRGWNNGVWVDMGLPTGFIYDSWVTMDIRLVGNTILYRVGDQTAIVPGLGTVQIANMILQGHNTASPGVTYDIYWDYFKSVGTKLAYSAVPVVISTSQYSAEMGSATDDCIGLLLISYQDGTPTSCPIAFTRTFTITDACGMTTQVNQLITIEDTQAPVVAGSLDPIVIEACEVPAPVSTVSQLEAMAGTLLITDCNPDNLLTVSSSDVAMGSCPTVVTRTYKVIDPCGLMSVDIVQTITFDDTTNPLSTVPPARTLEGCSLSDIPEAKVISLSPTQAVNTYYTDRYAPAGFVVENYMSGDRLKHTISNSDCESCRPGGFNTAFYNTQGRKFDTPNALSLAIDLYIPNDWAATGRRMAGLWGTGYNNLNAISAYPIIEFASLDGVPRFRVWDDGVWIDLGLPSGFVYNSWVTLDIRLVGNTILYRVGDLTATVPGLGTVEIRNMILQGHNTASPGVTYDIYWDNFKSVGAKLAYSAVPVVISSSQYSAELGSATDNCLGPITVSYQDGTPTSCPITFTRTFTITEACGMTTQVNQLITIEDTQAPVVAGSLDPILIEACEVPAPVSTVSQLEAMAGTLLITDCNPDNLLSVSSSDVAIGSCPTVVTRTYKVTDPCGLISVDIVQTITYDDTTDPLMTTPSDITLEGCTESNIPEAKVISLSPTQAVNTYYTDRYAPAGFVVENYLLADRLKHSIVAADCQTCRPIAYQDGFYNTQGRKYDTPNALSLAIDLYVPADWATTGRRMAGLWGTGYNNLNAISAYPIIEFASLDGVPRFRVWDDGVWVDLGLPSGFVYNSWVTLDIRLVGNIILYRVGDLTATVPGLGTVEIRNMILQGHNTASPGVTYDIYWDNFKSVGTKLGYSAVPVVISSSQYSAELGSATDNCYGPIEIEYVDVLQTPTCPNVRQILRTFKVTDACGNTSEDTQTIFIQDTQAPVVITPAGSLNETFQCDDVSGIANALTLTPSATDACAITLNLTSDNTVPGMNCPSAYVRTKIWNFTDACNTSATFTQVITVIDDTAPIVTCKSDMSRNTDSGVCTYTVVASEFDVTATDNCNLISYNYTLSGATMGSGMTTLTGVVFQKGVTTVSWTATDECNNTSPPTCSFEITVNDNQAPTVQSIPNMGAAIVGYSCGQTIIINTDVNSCAAGRTIIKPIWADNCGVMSSTATAVLNDIAITPVAISDFGTFVSGAFPLGITTITFKGTDNSGNMNTCTLLIEVKDITKPSIVNCPTNISVMAPLNACGAVVTWSPPPTAFDNCSGVTLVQTSAPTAGLGIGSIFPLEETIITYTATDASGNSTACSFTVEVEGTCSNQTEFTTTFLIDAASFNPGTQRDAIYTIDNIGTMPNNTQLKFNISLPSPKFTPFISDLNTPGTIFGFPFTSNNNDWEIVPVFIPSTSIIISYNCTLKLGRVINPGSSSIIKLSFTASLSGSGQGQTTGNILNGTGGDQNTNNNFAQSTFTINN